MLDWNLAIKMLLLSHLLMTEHEKIVLGYLCVYTQGHIPTYNRSPIFASSGSMFLMGIPRSLYIYFRSFQTQISQKILWASGGFELGSSEKKASALTTWPPPRPGAHVFQLYFCANLIWFSILRAIGEIYFYFFENASARARKDMKNNLLPISWFLIYFPPKTVPM